MVSGRGFVKMAGFQAAHWPTSLLIRCYEVRYSRPFRLNQEKKDFQSGKTLPLMTRITLIYTDRARRLGTKRIILRI